MAEKRLGFHLFQQGAENVSSKFGGVEKSLTSMAKSAMGTVASVYTLKKAFDFTVSAAIKEEETFRKLQTSVELTGKSWVSVKDDLDQMIASLQATTQYGDTETAEVFTTLIQLTGDYDKSVKGLPMALDLAATGLFDTGTAAKYVAMALEGNVEMLGRYIPELKATNNEIVKNGTAAEKSAEFMRIFNEKFAGTAQKNLQSTAGQMKQLQNYLGDIGEAIGDNVLPAINSMVGGLVKLLNNSNPVSDNLKIQIDKSSELRTEFENLAHTVLFLAEKESLSNEEMKIRDNAILKLQSQYPNYFNNLINEKDNYENLKTAISNARKSLIDYTNQMVQTAVVSKYTDQITDLTTKIIDNKTSIAELEIANDRLRTQINKTYEEQQISNQAIIQNNMLIEMAKKLNDDYAEKLKNLEERFKLAKEEAAKFSQTIAPSSESVNNTTSAIDNLDKEFDDYVNKMLEKSEADKKESEYLEKFIALYPAVASEMGLVTGTFSDYFNKMLEKANADAIEAEHLERFIALYPELADSMGLVGEKAKESVNNTTSAIDNLDKEFSDYFNKMLEKANADAIEAEHLERFIELYPELADSMGLVGEKAKELKEDQQALSEIATANSVIFGENVDFQIMKIDQQAEVYKQMKLDEVAIDQWAYEQKSAIMEKELFERNLIYKSIEAGYDQLINTLTDAEMTGKERREKIWEATRNSFIRFAGELVKEYIKQEIVRAAVSKAGESAAITSALITGRAVAAAYATPAALAATATFGAAAATGAASIAASIAATKAMANFAEGGIVPGYGANDTVPAMLTPGEVILNQSQQSNLVQNMGGITINVQGNLVATEEEADRFAQIIQERSKLGYNRIAIN